MTEQDRERTCHGRGTRTRQGKNKGTGRSSYFISWFHFFGSFSSFQLFFLFLSLFHLFTWTERIKISRKNKRGHVQEINQLWVHSSVNQGFSIQGSLPQPWTRLNGLHSHGLVALLDSVLKKELVSQSRKSHFLTVSTGFLDEPSDFDLEKLCRGTEFSAEEPLFALWMTIKMVAQRTQVRTSNATLMANKVRGYSNFLRMMVASYRAKIKKTSNRKKVRITKMVSWEDGVSLREQILKRTKKEGW